MEVNTNIQKTIKKQNPFVGMEGILASSQSKLKSITQTLLENNEFDALCLVNEAILNMCELPKRIHNGSVSQTNRLYKIAIENLKTLSQGGLLTLPHDPLCYQAGIVIDGVVKQFDTYEASKGYKA